MAQVQVVNKKDDIKGMIASFLVSLLVLFLLFFIKYAEPDPPKITVPIPISMAEEGIEEFDIHNAGGGTPSESIENTPDPQPSAENIETQAESPVSVPTGNGESSSNTNQNNTPTNPFSGNGTGGSGTSGSGGGFGSDNGQGSGSGNPGSGSNGDRVRQNNLSSNPKTPNTSVCQIAMKLIIDSNGNVVAVSEIRDKTTTTNQALIDEVKALVKKEVKYDKRPGAANATVYYTVTVRPT